MSKKSEFQKRIDDRELSSQIQLHMEMESQNLFKNDVRRRKAMSGGKRKIAILAVVLVVLFLVSVFLVPVGNLSAWAYRLNLISNFKSIFALDMSARMRICAFGAIVFAGLAMAVSGAVFQGVFQNPMASPTILGVQSGGLLGGLIYILFFLNGTESTFYTEHLTGGTSATDPLIFSALSTDIYAYRSSLTQYEKFSTEIWEILGCFFGVALIVGISMLAGKGKISTVALMLAGGIFSTVVNQLAQTVQYIILYNKPEEMEDARYYLISNLMGSGSGIDGNIMEVDQFLWIAIPITICLIVLFSMSSKMNILMFGAEEAKAMGVPVQAYRVILIIFCTLACAVVLSFVGPVSMLGFLVPHLVRFYTGPDFKVLVPASALMGGIVTLLIWDFCSVMNALDSFNLYTGIVCSVVSIFFILFYRRNRHADWS